VLIKLEDFGGLIPRMSDRLLPVQAATVARNTKLLSGEIRGLRYPRLLEDFSMLSYTVRRAFRWEYVDQYGDTQEFWQTFGSADVDVLRSPILNDSYDRYYWTGDGGKPMYNTRDRILAGLDPYVLGVPAPTLTPTLTAPALDMYDPLETTRSYVYTFVSAYGEESAPSEPVLATGDQVGTWTLSNMMNNYPGDLYDSRNITTKKIYRTVPGNVSTAFFFVAEIPLAQTEYNDTIADDVVALNNLLETANWAEPPTDLTGWVTMPNGYVVGWKDRTLYMSEPYRPHAWPVEYQVGTEFEIVGLVVWGFALIIGTKSQPYVGQGVIPASFTMQKMDAVEPCLSRRGMVATTMGAYYPSINGLVMVNATGVNLITQDILTKEEWAGYNPSDIFASQLGLQYIAFNSDNFGFVFNPLEPKTKLIELDFFNQVTGVQTDKYTGNVYIIRSDRVYDWDPETDERLFWQWKSKEFHLPKPINFGAVKIKFETQAQAVVVDTTNQAYLQSFNDARILQPLNTLNTHVLNGPKSKDVDTIYFNWTEAQNRGPLGGSELYNFSPDFSQPAITRFRVYAGRELVYDNAITDELIMRLPVGFKRDIWQFELLSNSNVYSVTIAETGKELAGA
jgi:hypothetical protein